MTTLLADIKARRDAESKTAILDRIAASGSLRGKRQPGIWARLKRLCGVRA